MKKIKIVTDSNSCLQYLDVDHDIDIIKMPLNFGNTTFFEGDNITAEQFYQKLKESDEIPSTSQPAIGYLLEMFEEYAKQGYSDIIVIPISSGLSGTYQTVVMSDSMLDNINVHAFDPMTTHYGQARIALKADEMVKEGQGVEEILTKLTEYREGHEYMFVVDNIKYLVKNGRLSNAAGFIGNMLKIKPCLHLGPHIEGKIYGFDKVRTLKKAINKISDIIADKVVGKDYEVVIGHTDEMEMAYLLEAALNERNVRVDKKLFVSPTIGAHVGSGVVAVGYFLSK